MKQSEEVKSQLDQICTRIGLKQSKNNSIPTTTYNINIRKCLLTGYFMQSAYLPIGSPKYITIRDNENVELHPSCVLDNKPRWVIYNEYIITTREYIRTCTRIEGDWLLEIAPHYYTLENFSDSPAKKALVEIQRKRQFLSK